MLLAFIALLLINKFKKSFTLFSCWTLLWIHNLLYATILGPIITIPHRKERFFFTNNNIISPYVGIMLIAFANAAALEVYLLLTIDKVPLGIAGISLKQLGVLYFLIYL